MWKETGRGNICVTRGAFRGCGPSVHPSVCGKELGERNCYILRCCRGVYARVARYVALHYGRHHHHVLPKSNSLRDLAFDVTIYGAANQPLHQHLRKKIELNLSRKS